MEVLEFPLVGFKPTKIHRDGKQGNFVLVALFHGITPLQITLAQQDT